MSSSQSTVTMLAFLELSLAALTASHWFLPAGAAAAHHSDSGALQPSHSLSLAPVNGRQCPIPCTNNNQSDWDAVETYAQLAKCEELVLFSMPLNATLHSQDQTLQIRACSVSEVLYTGKNATKTPDVSHHNVTSLTPTSHHAADSCVSEIKAGSLQVVHTGPSHLTNLDETLIRSLYSHVRLSEPCSERALFAHHNGTVSALYAGKNFAIAALNASLETLLRENGEQYETSTTKELFAEICGDYYDSHDIFGFAIADSSQLAKVHGAVQSWHIGSCYAENTSQGREKTSENLPTSSSHSIYTAIPVRVTPSTAFHNSTTSQSNPSGFPVPATGSPTLAKPTAEAPYPTHNSSSLFIANSSIAKQYGTAAPYRSYTGTAETNLTRGGLAQPKGPHIACRTVTVQRDDGCGELAKRCEIKPADFTELHKDDPDFCSTLVENQLVCCTPGVLPPPPRPDEDGYVSCNRHSTICICSTNIFRKTATVPYITSTKATLVIPLRRLIASRRRTSSCLIVAETGLGDGKVVVYS